MKTNGDIDKNIEKMFLRFSVVCFSLLIIFQGLLFAKKDVIFFKSGMNFLNNDIGSTQPIFPVGSITLNIKGNGDYSSLFVLVNGHVYGNFKEGKINLLLRNKDVVEIDGSNLENPVCLKITEISENLKGSDLKDEYMIGHSKAVLFTAKI